MAQPSETPLTDDNVLFSNIDGELRSTEVESYCVNCGENGTTRFLLTVIPHFKEVVLMAFDCPHCGYRNNEIQSAATLAPLGMRLTLSIGVGDKTDIGRQVVKSEHATVRFDELDFEIPGSTQKGKLTTIEGLIQNAIEGLSQDQPHRKEVDPVVYEKVQQVIETLRDYSDAKKPFTFIIDDPAGNSHVENPYVPNFDPKSKLTHYKRTREMIEAMGYTWSDEQDGDGAGDGNTQELTTDELPFHEQIHSFQGACSHCHEPCETKMHMLDIPYFKEVIVMAVSCEHCGYKSNEVKAGGAISPQGKRITLKVTDADDLSRDILKSETCGVSIPEIELELMPGTLGGRFTTIEGLLTQVLGELEQRSEFISGDSADDADKKTFQKFLDNLNKVLKLEICPFTIILDDPLSNSHLQNPYAPDDDPNMTIEMFDRTWEQNENYGLNDIDVGDDHGDRHEAADEDAIEEDDEEDEADAAAATTHDE
eukprot:jgi/Hompol1/5005/HPOL_004088-RA